MIRIFLQKLDDLYVKGELNLLESLCCIAGRSGEVGESGKIKNRIEKTAEYLYQQIEEGNLLSNGFSSCPYISFDSFFVSFIAIAERTGNLREVISFLNAKYERRYKCRQKIFEACIYPLFVVFLAILSCVMLLNYLENGMNLALLKILSGLFFVCAVLMFFISKVLSENKLYEAFLAIDFLLNGGVGLSVAISCGVQLLGINTALGRAFEEAREKLELGMSLHHALKLGKKYEEGFFFADKTGIQTKVFGKMADWINLKTERRMNICMTLIEPMFILITGIFILILILKFFMPYMNSMYVFNY